MQLIAQIFWTGLAMAVPTGPVPFGKHCRLERGGSADRAMPYRIADEASLGAEPLPVAHLCDVDRDVRFPLACSRRTLALTYQDTRPMASGTVKWFNSTKGFGFIQPDSGGKDVFVHISAVERAGLQGLNEGQKISYEVQTERGREAAVNLKV